MAVVWNTVHFLLVLALLLILVKRFVARVFDIGVFQRDIRAFQKCRWVVIDV